ELERSPSERGRLLRRSTAGMLCRTNLSRWNVGLSQRFCFVRYVAAVAGLFSGVACNALFDIEDPVVVEDESTEREDDSHEVPDAALGADDAALGAGECVLTSDCSRSEVCIFR